MPRGIKKSDTDEQDVMEAHDETPTAPAIDFRPIPGMIRLLRKPFALGAPRYHFKSVIGVANHNGRAIKKVIAPIPVKDGARWEEWLVQDNPGNRATIETGFRDPAFCYTAIYPEDKDAAAKFKAAVKSYIAQLDADSAGLDARFQKIQAEAEKIEGEMAELMDGTLSEEDNARLEALNKREQALSAERFDAEKAFRLAKAQVKAQRELLGRLG